MTEEFITQIPLPMEWNYEAANVYLINDADQHWLIDAGEKHDNNIERLTGALNEKGLDWSGIDRVLATHLHPDHVGLAFKILKRNPDIQFFIPEGPSFEKRTPDRVRKWLTRTGIPSDFHDEFLKKITEFPYIEFMDELKDRAITFQAGEVFKLGDLRIEALEAHGHTPNQVVFYVPDKGALFSGDHVLLNETPNVSLFPEYMGGNPLGDFHESLERLLDRTLITIYPGHGEPFHNGENRVRELIHHHGERFDHCVEVMSEEPQSALDVATQIPWGNGSFDELDQINSYLALGESLAHLKDLSERGKIDLVREDGVDYFIQGS